MINVQKLDALSSWLVAGAPPQTDFCDTVAEFCKKLTQVGINMDYVTVSGRALNPLVDGMMVTWSPKAGARRQDSDHKAMNSAIYIGSIVHGVEITGRMIRHRLGDGSIYDEHQSTPELMRRGYKEFVGLPLMVNGKASCMLRAGTKRESGFPDDEIQTLRQIAAPLARIVEAEILHRNTEALLGAYLGHDAALHVMDGKILRGEAEVIPAVILFADFKGFTELSNSTAPVEVIKTLNRFFDAIETPVRENGGSILKFMGDGVLAIFPTPDDLTAQTVAAAGALSAVDEARTTLADETGIDFRAALHVGDIHYGNIGSATRLDFTAIGPAVNLTSRMLEAASESGVDTVCSADFAALSSTHPKPLAEFSFKGFGFPTMVYSVAK